MKWFLATTYYGKELECSARINRYYPELKTYVPIGKKINKQKNAEYKLIDFAGYGGYIFTEIPKNYNFREFILSTRITGFIRNGDNFAEIPGTIIDKVKSDELSNSFSTKTAQAILYFESKIGQDIMITNGMLTGRTAKIISISGTYVRVRTDISGSTIEHSVPAKLIFGKDQYSKAQLLEIGGKIICPTVN